MAFDDTLREILEENEKNGYNIHNLPVLSEQPQDNNTQYSNSNDLSTLLQAAGIGGASMLNGLFGGLGQILGSIGSGVEAVSPFSGGNEQGVLHLVRAGIPLAEAQQIYPHQDSWITSLGKSVLDAQNYIGDNISEWRQNTLGNNPTLAAQIAEGTGSSIGFLLAGLGAGAGAAALGTGTAGSALAGALASGGLEALSESGASLGDAYRNGQYDDGGLAAANKSFAANWLLNTGLDATLGNFSILNRGIKNPVLNFGRKALEQTVNELLQEPSQQIIEKAASESITNGGGFSSALYNELPNWWETAKQAAPSVIGSTLLTQGLLGAGNMATRQGRQNFVHDWEQSRVKTHAKEQLDDSSLDTILAPPAENQRRLSDSLQREYQLKEQLLSDLLNAQNQNQDKNKIDIINQRMQKNDSRINSLTDLMLPETFTPTNAEAIENLTRQTQAQTQNGQEFPRKQRLRRNSNDTNTAPLPLDAPDNPQKNNPAVISSGEKDITQNNIPENVPAGNKVKIITARGTEVESQYRVIEADQLITSNLDDGRINHNYPRELQPRNRSNDFNDQIKNIALHPDPERLADNRMASDGAPVIGSDRIVESGNGRILGLSRSYRLGKAEQYRQFLIDNAPKWGLDPDAVRSMRAPVLVRERLTPVNRANFASEANEASIASMSTTENAFDDARAITPDMLNSLDINQPIRGNSQFVHLFRGRMSPNERNSMTNAQKGTLNRTAYERANNALTALAYGDNAIVAQLAEDEEENMRNISKALTDAAPALAVMHNGSFNPDLLIQEDITEAVSRLQQARNSKKSVSEFLAQPDLLDPISHNARALMQFFDGNKRSPNAISQGLRNYVALAQNEAQVGQAVMFDDSVRTKENILEQAIRSVETEIQNGNEQSQNQYAQSENTKANGETFYQTNRQENGNTFALPLNDDSSERNVREQIEAVRKQYEGTDQWPKAPNKKTSNLNEQQWLQVRTPNFRRWFGNWNYDGDTQVKVTDVIETNLEVDYKDTKAVKKWLANNYAGKTVQIESDGSIIGFSSKKLGDSLKRRGEAQRSAYAALEDLVRNAVYYNFESNDGKNKHKNLAGQDVYYSAMKIGDNFYSVKFKFDVLKESLSRTYKDHKISEITVSPLVYHTQTRDNNSATYARTGDTFAFTLSDLTEGVKPEHVSKNVDENGEPLAVEREGQLVFVNNDGQTKSATDNNGMFNGNNPDIYKQSTLSEEVNKERENSSSERDKWNSNTQYDGFIGSLDIEHNGDNYSANVFADEDNGRPYLDFTDENGNSLAVYDINNDQFIIRPESSSTGWVRRIEGDFRRQFGNNPTEEILHRTFRQQAIDAGVELQNADAAASVYTAGNKFFAHYSGLSLWDTVKADNIAIVRDNSDNSGNSRGSTVFSKQKTDSSGNVIQDAQIIINLFQNADKSTLLHELGHIFLRKFQSLAHQGLLNGNAKLDWGSIIREYGLQNIDFSKELSAQDKARWTNANEMFASGLEKYFLKGQTPPQASSRIKRVFEAFKNWLKDIYGSLRNISYTDAQGHQKHFSLSKDIQNVFDHLMKDNYISQTLDNNTPAEVGTENENEAQINLNANNNTPIQKDENINAPVPVPVKSEQPEMNNSQTADNNYHSQPRQGFFDWVKNIGKKIFSPVFSIAHVPHKPSITDFQDLRFENEKSEQGYTENQTSLQPTGIIARIKNTARSVTHSLKGDFPELSASPRAKELNLYNALNALRELNRRKKNAVSAAMASFALNLKGLNPHQRDLFARFRLLDDLLWRKNNNPDAELPFGFDDTSLRREHKRFTSMAVQDKKVWDAVQAEERTMQKINSDFVKYAGLLGINLDGVFKNPHYYRHIIIDYANTTASGRFRPSAKGNIDVQGLADTELRAILGRGYMKKYKGSAKNISTNYVQANAEVRAQMLQDIETLKTLLELKKNFDIAPKLRKHMNANNTVNSKINPDEETYSQSDNESPETLSDNIPDGYEAFDPANTRLVESAHSSAENLFSMAADDISLQTGIPLDKILHHWGIDEDAQNRLCVFPSEIVEALRKLSQRRHRGSLGQAAKTLTTWWKKAVLFSPTRNLKYNLRNFTGDLDALIAGNPHALTLLPRSVKELTDYFMHNSKEDFTASQDLQDYIDLSGSLGIESLSLSPSEAQKILDVLQSANNNSKSSALDKINIIKKLFKAETSFTEWREHLLRYAAYLDYKNQMENNQDGKPNNWGASIEDEVMALDNIKARAFKMSNELLGAYDQVSEVGKQLRDMLIPFYSWMEVNLRRYYRLFKNAAKGGSTKNLLGQIMLGKTAAVPAYMASSSLAFAKIAAFTLATQLFNRIFWPDADDDLPEDVKYRPHITLGKNGNDVYYFDRIGALADAADWLSLDSVFLDIKDITNGQQSLAGYLKKMLQAPFNKAINGLNPMIKMPIELAMGRSMFPDVFHPSTIRDPYKYIASSFGLTWPYKALTGEPHSTMQELTNLGIYSLNADEAAYWQTLDKVRQFQNNVLDKHFDGFATTARGRILQRLKLALRFNDKQAVRRYIREYYQADGSKQGLKASMKAMHPLHSLSEKEKAQFLRWLTPDDRKYLRKAERYFHQLVDKFIR